MTTETVRVKLPTYKTVIEIEGKDLVLSFRQLRRNERVKLQIDITRAVELLKKEARTAEEDAFVKQTLEDGSNRAVELLESVEGSVSIGGQEITLDAIKSGELPEPLYSAISAAHQALSEKLNNIKAEAAAKNVVPPIDSPSA